MEEARMRRAVADAVAIADADAITRLRRRVLLFACGPLGDPRRVFEELVARHGQRLVPTAGDAGGCGALAFACGKGNLPAARWPRVTYGLEAADARDEDNQALRCAAKGGHVAALEWVI
jgi:hypothetical protein